jgi:peptide/nickel transport system substrate-binding protein
MDDVVFSLQAVFTKNVQSMAVDLLTFGGRPVKWRRIDGRRIEFSTDQPQGFFLRLIQGLVIVPRHKLSGALARGGAAFNTTWGVNTPARELVGTGPFVMQSYLFGQRVTYARNPAYWRVDRSGQRLPYLDRLHVQIVPNLDAEKLKFLARETDIYGARNREFAELKLGEARGNYTIYDGPETFSSEYLVFNQNPRGLTGPKLAWFQDAAFRRALNHAIDRGAVVRQVYAGRATPAWSPVSTALARYYNPNLRKYEYDLERAQRLLEEAGYKKGDGGTLRDAKGNAVAFTLATNAENADRVAIANIVRQDFTKLGIQVTLSPEAFGTLVTKLDNTFKWDVIILGLGGDTEPGTGRSYWLSSGSLHDWNPRQQAPSTPWEAEIDRLFEQAARETNAEKRRTLYWRWQEIVADHVPVLYFTNPKTQPAVRNTLGNTRLGLQGATGRLESRYYRAPR